MVLISISHLVAMALMLVSIILTLTTISKPVYSIFDNFGTNLSLFLQIISFIILISLMFP